MRNQTWTIGGSGYAVLQNEQIVYNRMFNNDSVIEDDEIVENDKPIIDITGKANGVYAVTAEGELIAYDDAAVDATCLGVALITDNQKVMIAKVDATDGTNNTFYWGKNLQDKDVAGITETTNSLVAKTDFNGKVNTAAIIAAYDQHSVDMDSRDMCKVLSSYTEGGFTDWYIPTLGQLYEMYKKKSDINTALANIGDTALESDCYWSSSEGGVNRAWYVNFNNGYVYGDLNKYRDLQVRFVRDLQ